MRSLALFVTFLAVAACGNDDLAQWDTTLGGKGETATLPPDSAMGALHIVAPIATLEDTAWLLNQTYFSHAHYLLHQAGFLETRLSAADGDDRTEFLSLGRSYVLPAGNYIVVMNDTFTELTVEGGKETKIHAGRIEVAKASGQSYVITPALSFASYKEELRNRSGERRPIPQAFSTGTGINVMPGTYTVTVSSNGLTTYEGEVVLSPDK